jgi:hypothetical protein
MHKPTEFYTVLRWFPAMHFGTHTTPAGWGQITDSMLTEDEAWEAYVEGFKGEDAPTRHNSVVVKIDLAEGTSRDLSEDWASAYAEAFPPVVEFDEDDYGDWKYEQRRDDRLDEVAA